MLYYLQKSLIQFPNVMVTNELRKKTIHKIICDGHPLSRRNSDHYDKLLQIQQPQKRRYKTCHKKV